MHHDFLIELLSLVVSLFAGLKTAEGIQKLWEFIAEHVG